MIKVSDMVAKFNPRSKTLTTSSTSYNPPAIGCVSQIIGDLFCVRWLGGSMTGSYRDYELTLVPAIGSSVTVDGQIGELRIFDGVNFEIAVGDKIVHAHLMEDLTFSSSP